MDNDVRVAVQCKDAISFPMDIDLTKFVHPVAGGARTEQPLQYTLTAIILHRGSSASSGHYVSIVKDERLGMWWKYDDDSVTNMGVHPFKGVKWDPVGGDAEANGSTGAKKASTKKKSAAKAGKAAPKAPAAASGTKAQGGKAGAGTRGGKKSEVIQIEEGAGTPDGPETCHVAAPAAPATGAPAPTPPPAAGCRRKRSLADVSNSCARTPALASALAGHSNAASKRLCAAQPASAPPASGAACSSLGDVQICTPASDAAEPGAGVAVGAEGDAAGAISAVIGISPKHFHIGAEKLRIFFYSILSSLPQQFSATAHPCCVCSGYQERASPPGPQLQGRVHAHLHARGLPLRQLRARAGLCSIAAARHACNLRVHPGEPGLGALLSSWTCGEGGRR